MRLTLTLLIFVMASVTVAGAILTAALSAPELGLITFANIGWVAGAGFVIALPLSYRLAGMLLNDKGAGRKDG